MTHKRNARAPRPDPAAQEPMDYLLDDITSAVDRVATELHGMANLEADPVAALAEHCHTLAGRVAALAEVVRQMRDLQRGLVVISDPPMPAPQLITEDQALAAQQRAQAERTLVHWRMGSGGYLEPVYEDKAQTAEVRDGRVDLLQAAMLGWLGADQDLAAGADPAEVRDGLDAGTDGQLDGLQANLEDDLEASRPRRKMTEAEALAKAERLGGMAGAVFLMRCMAGAHGGGH